MANAHLAKFLREKAHELVQAIRSCPDPKMVSQLEQMSAELMDKAAEIEAVGTGTPSI